MRKLVVWRIYVIFSILMVEMTYKESEIICAHKIKINANNYGDSTGKPDQIDTPLESRFIV